MSTKRKTVLAVVLCAAAGIAIGTVARRTSLAVETVAATDGYHPADITTASAIGTRVTEYWKARTRQDLPGAYPFYESSFRSTYGPDAFVNTFQRLNRFGPIFDGIDRIEISPDGMRAKVFVKLRATSPLDGAPIVTTTEDVWLLADGTWWRQAEAMTPTM